jgi:hypothetical protein
MLLYLFSHPSLCPSIHPSVLSFSHSFILLSLPFPPIPPSLYTSGCLSVHPSIYASPQSLTGLNEGLK